MFYELFFVFLLALQVIAKIIICFWQKVTCFFETKELEERVEVMERMERLLVSLIKEKEVARGKKKLRLFVSFFLLIYLVSLGTIARVERDAENRIIIQCNKSVNFVFLQEFRLMLELELKRSVELEMRPVWQKRSNFRQKL
jgi:hypothetical protein